MSTRAWIALLALVLALLALVLPLAVACIEDACRRSHRTPPAPAQPTRRSLR